MPWAPMEGETVSAIPRTLRRPCGGRRHLHVSTLARQRYGLRGELFGLRGRLLLGDLSRAHDIAEAINGVREASRYPETAVRAGEIYAAALIHELMHALIEATLERGAPALFGRTLERAAGELGAEALEASLAAFATLFPAPEVADGRPVPAYLGASTEGVSNREVVLEEALLVWLANANPALERLHELFDDAALRRSSAYERLVPLVEAELGGVDGGSPAGETLLDLLYAPQRRSPTSLEGQLEVIRERWGPLLGGRYRGLLERLLRSVDVLREERKPGAVGPGPAPVLDAAVLRAGTEIEAFSPDSDWMPRAVLVAKSAYVWMVQLERRYGREVRRLDQIPDEALAELAESGFNGLWLIGVWQRSEASRRIKHRRGQVDAVASAYALYDYAIADDLGGEAAYHDLRERAGRHGLRLASDMVPNHVGIDGRWVIEHPDWFVQLDHPPYPGYRFGDPDLSADARVGVRIEDHYWDGSDAAVVFERRDDATGERRYIYHGNDGTAMPWNDTAQLDYLKPEVREAVIQTILHVARMFPIIRFDAAMTLAKQHVQRLWYPAPGHGGAIPSRSQYGSLPEEEFERRIPVEFWREVVDRVAAEAPGTLLLAEAFWMMEGYFVRTLGMHRVYNSAFMNMLKREENADYRTTMKNVLAFDPRILERFVNFMNNPDEETAIAQFGDGDKYFGVATLMATLPGLPMFGHGQVEGLREKYGMEYRSPKLDERPDERMVARHRAAIAPLLHRRASFAGVRDFRLFDLQADGGGVNEDVFAYANRGPGGASLVLYNNRYARASGRVSHSVPHADGSGGTRSDTLADALGLRGGVDDFVVLRDPVRDHERLLPSAELCAHGLHVVLDGFEVEVYVDVRELRDDDGSLDALARRLGGAPVPDVEAARRDLRLEPVHGAFLTLLRAAAAGDRQRITRAATTFVEAVRRDGAAELRPAGRVDEGGAAEPASDAKPAVGEAASARVDAGPTSDAGAIGAIVASLGLGRPGAAPPPGPEAGPEAGPEVGAAQAGSAESIPAQTAPAAAPAAPSMREGEALAPLPASAAGDAPGGSSVARATEEPGLAWSLRAADALAGLEDPGEVYGSLRLRPLLERALAAGAAADAAACAALVPVLWALRAEVAAAAAPPGRRDGGPAGAAEGLLRALSEAPAARELLRVHRYEGVWWFDRGRYRLLRDALIGAVAVATAPDAAARDAAERLARVLDAAEVRSGYRLERLREARADATERAAGDDDGDAEESEGPAVGETGRERGDAGG